MKNQLALLSWLMSERAKLIAKGAIPKAQFFSISQQSLPERPALLDRVKSNRIGLNQIGIKRSILTISFFTIPSINKLPIQL